MKKIPVINYHTKYFYLRRKQDDICPICGEFLTGSADNSLDHKYLHNTETNRKLYPNILHSVWNLQAVHNSCNIDKRKRDKMGRGLAKKLEERVKKYNSLYNKIHLITIKGDI